MALLRIPRGDGRGAQSSVLRALAKAFELGFDPLDCALAEPWTAPRPAVLRAVSEALWRTAGDTRERLELRAAQLIEQALDGQLHLPDGEQWCEVQSIFDALREVVAPRLDACGPAEMRFDRCLAGTLCTRRPQWRNRAAGDWMYCPPGAISFSVDVRNLLTTAWRIGFQSANLILERHLQDHGDHLRQLGLSVWGTATMRTGDIAQAMALMGVRPVWATGSQRVDDFEILPVSLLDRPCRCDAAGVRVLS